MIHSSKVSFSSASLSPIFLFFRFSEVFAVEQKELIVDLTRDVCGVFLGRGVVIILEFGNSFLPFKLVLEGFCYAIIAVGLSC